MQAVTARVPRPRRGTFERLFALPMFPGDIMHHHEMATTPREVAHV